MHSHEVQLYCHFTPLLSDPFQRFSRIGAELITGKVTRRDSRVNGSSRIPLGCVARLEELLVFRCIHLGATAREVGTELFAYLFPL